MLRAFSVLAVKRTDALSIQVVRYAVVGGIATIADAGTLSLAHEYILSSFHGSLYMAVALGFVVGLVVNYCLSVRWVFASRKLGSSTIEFTVFGVIGVIGLGLTELVFYISESWFGMHYMFTKAIAVFIVFIWNFGMRRMLLFSGRGSHV